MINKKELEIELAKKGVDDLRAFEINEKFEGRILKLEVVVRLHSDDIKHISECLESNESIIERLNEKIGELDGRFKRHLNNVDVHTSVQ